MASYAQRHIGIGYMDRAIKPGDGNFTTAASMFQKSLDMKKTAEALRNLAIVAHGEGRHTDAYSNYVTALKIATAGSDSDPEGQKLLVRDLSAESSYQFALLKMTNCVRENSGNLPPTENLLLSTDGLPRRLQSISDLSGAVACFSRFLLTCARLMTSSHSKTDYLTNTGSDAIVPEYARHTDRWRFAQVGSAFGNKDWKTFFMLCDCSTERLWPAIGWWGGGTMQLLAWYESAVLQRATATAGHPLSQIEMNGAIRANPVPFCLRAVGH